MPSVSQARVWEDTAGRTLSPVFFSALWTHLSIQISFIGPVPATRTIDPRQSCYRNGQQYSLDQDDHHIPFSSSYFLFLHWGVWISPFSCIDSATWTLFTLVDMRTMIQSGRIRDGKAGCKNKEPGLFSFMLLLVEIFIRAFYDVCLA
jgi:hypothetical protein